MDESLRIPMIAGVRHRLSGFGPGLRSVVFFKGCGMNCPDCAHPEHKNEQAQLFYNPVYCTGCRACVCACARGLHTFDRDCVHHIELSRCAACFFCVRACKSGALTACGEQYTPEGLGKVILRAYAGHPGFIPSVTLAGGEPALFDGFVQPLLAYCRGYGVHTALLTRGCAPPRQLLASARAADLVLFELKAYSVDLHERMTGIHNIHILSNLRLLCAQGLRLHIRIPVVPGISDRPDQAAGLSDLLEELDGIARIELFIRPSPLSAARAGSSFPVRGVEADSAQVLKDYALPFLARGLPVHIR